MRYHIYWQDKILLKDLELRVMGVISNDDSGIQTYSPEIRIDLKSLFKRECPELQFRPDTDHLKCSMGRARQKELSSMTEEDFSLVEKQRREKNRVSAKNFRERKSEYIKWLNSKLGTTA